MNHSDAIVIRKIGNGFMVEPYYESGMVAAVFANMHCFQQLGRSAGDSYPQSLIDWLEAHFTEPKK